MSTTFNLPDVGEGLTEAEIVSWKVTPGESITVNQILVEIETAKSLVELPSPEAGTVGALLVEEGQTVEVGTPIIRFGAAGDTGSAAPDGDADAGSAASDDAGESGATLVGYGVRPTSSKRRARVGGGEPRTELAQTAIAPAQPEPVPVQPEPAAAPARPLAKPPVRKLAKDNSLDLASVSPTGERERSPGAMFSPRSRGRQGRVSANRSMRSMPGNGRRAPEHRAPNARPGYRSRASAKPRQPPWSPRRSALRTSRSSWMSMPPAPWTSSNT